MEEGYVVKVEKGLQFLYLNGKKLPRIMNTNVEQSVDGVTFMSFTVKCTLEDTK